MGKPSQTGEGLMDFIIPNQGEGNEKLAKEKGVVALCRWGVVGMLVGVALFAEVYPGLEESLLTWGDLGKVTLPQIFGLDHWLVIFVLTIAGLVLFRWFERKKL